MSYASAAEFRAWVDVDDVDDASEIQMVLDAATRSIDRLCGRHFTLETGVTKTYTAVDPWCLPVTDLISVTSLTVDIDGRRTFSRTLTTANYELLPYVDEAGLAPVRFQEVRILPTSSTGFAPGYLVRIAGNFGYVVSGAAPSDVKTACAILAARLWKRRETPLGALSVPDLGTFQQIRKTDPDVAALLEPYSKRESWVVR